VLPPDVAPFGDAPPPVGPVAPPDVPPLVPPPEVPEDELPLLPDVPEEPLDEPEDPEEADEPEDPDEAEAEGEEPLDEDVVVVFVVAVVAPLFVAAGEELIVWVGTVRGGAPAVSVVAVPPPHAARAAHAPTPAMSAAIRPSGFLLGTAERRVTTKPQTSSGSMRRPQCGQSLRSFWQSWSHQLQKRRFSTAQGSSDDVGARGRSSATTSSGSPVSRSR
jgi:hypothetical protein